MIKRLRSIAPEGAALVRLRLQDPEAEDPRYLLEALVATAAQASRGAGHFAFASRDGVRALLGAAPFQEFLARAEFDLVVGIDAITDLSAIHELSAQQAASPNLSVKVFMHQRPRTTFHPKVCWFETEVGGTLFVGSGNLTVKGLSENWEAYAAIDLTQVETAEIEADWDAWTERHAHHMFALDDPGIVVRAEANVWVPPPPLALLPPAPGQPVQAGEAGDFLLAEIPKGSTRWAQANFSLDVFTGFFGADPAHPQNLVMRRLNIDGSLDGIELRPSVSVKSHNFRIELEAAAGLAYPAGEARPIGAFKQSGERQFSYVLLMPDMPQFAVADELLNATVGAAVGNRMRRVVLDRASIATNWPQSPLLLEEVQEQPEA